MENEGLNVTTITEYDETDAAIIASFLEKHDQAYHKEGKCLAQTYSLEKGLTKFKEQGKRVAIKEVSQLINRKVFEPIKLEQ